MAAPGVLRHFALHASTSYHFARGWPRQNPPLLEHSMGLSWQIQKACAALVPNEYDMSMQMIWLQMIPNGYDTYHIWMQASGGIPITQAGAQAWSQPQPAVAVGFKCPSDPGQGTRAQGLDAGPAAGGSLPRSWLVSRRTHAGLPTVSILFFLEQ